MNSETVLDFAGLGEFPAEPAKANHDATEASEPLLPGNKSHNNRGPAASLKIVSLFGIYPTGSIAAVLIPLLLSEHR